MQVRIRSVWALSFRGHLLPPTAFDLLGQQSHRLPRDKDAFAPIQRGVRLIETGEELRTWQLGRVRFRHSPPSFASTSARA